MNSELEKLGLPSAVNTCLLELGITSPAEFTLHFDTPEQRVAFSEWAEIPVEQIAAALNVARETLPKEVVENGQSEPEPPYSYGVLPPDEILSRYENLTDEQKNDREIEDDTSSEGGDS